MSMAARMAASIANRPRSGKAALSAPRMRGLVPATQHGDEAAFGCSAKLENNSAVRARADRIKCYFSIGYCHHAGRRPN
jgi:hypothetical protein